MYPSFVVVVVVVVVVTFQPFSGFSGFQDWVLGIRLVREQVLKRADMAVRKQSHGLYPAPHRIIEVGTHARIIDANSHDTNAVYGYVETCSEYLQGCC